MPVPAKKSLMRNRPTRNDIFTAETLEQLQNAIKDLAIEVPARGQGRTTDHCEQWQIQHLLQALLEAGQLHPPVALRKGESPDFLLETSTRCIGIENTEAINPDYARATVHPNAREGGSVVDPSLYKWGAHGRPSQQIAEEAGRTELTGDGWAGDSVEREFAESVVDLVDRKNRKLRSLYEKLDSDRLLIYHNQTLPCIDFGSALSYTKDALAHRWGPSAFDTVYVHVFDRIFRFTADDSRVLKLPR